MRRKTAGIPFAMPLPKPKAVKVPVPPPKGLIKVDAQKMSMNPEILERQFAQSGGPYCTMTCEQMGDGGYSRNQFGVQETETGWKVYGMWQAEGTGEAPILLRMLAMNHGILNDLMGRALRLGPVASLNVEKGELYAEERSQGGWDNFWRRLGLEDSPLRCLMDHVKEDPMT